MKKRINRVLSLALVCSLIGSMPVFADTVRVRYRGTAAPGELVGLMVVDKDANPEDLNPNDIFSTDIIAADADGTVDKTVELPDATVDAVTGTVNEYKAISNIALTEEVLDVKQTNVKYDFESFTVRPAVIDGVLYVPIAETLTKVGEDTVTYTYDEESKTYTGSANNGDFTIVMGKGSIEVDWVDVELPGPIREYRGSAMMPAYAIEYLLKTGALSYDETSFTLAEGVQPKFKDREIDYPSVVKGLPAPERTVISHSDFLYHMSKYGAEDLVALSVQDVEIDGTTHTARQIETVYDRFGTIPSVDSVEVSTWFVDQPFYKKEIGLLSFKARATRITDESGSAKVGVKMQTMSNWALAIEDYIAVTDQWQQFYLPAYNAFNDYPASYGARICFTVGGKPMTLQITDFSFVSYGENESVKAALTEVPDATGYKGIEEDHVWRKEAKNRVEKYRKEDLSFLVTDTDGNPIKDAEIKVDMTENEFMFGAAMCENEVLNLDMTSVKGKTLDRFMTNDINAGVCADMMKSDGVIASDGTYGTEMVNEYLKRGMRVRGHCMYWDGVGAAYLDAKGKENYDKMYTQTMDYVRSMAYQYRGKLAQWDVINEPVSNNYVRMHYNTTRLYSDIFKEINRIDPSVRLYINETGIEGRKNKQMADRIPNLIHNIVEPLQREGAPVHGIGVQAHCTNYYYPQGFYHQLSELADAVDEVAVTEYDFYNEDTTYAPNHLEDLLLATISQPKATAFIIWNPEDSMHWRWDNAAPFFRRDWSSKPAHVKWQDLIQNVYTTKETLHTNENGRASVRAFRGDYAITLNYDGKTKTVALGNTNDGGSSVAFVIDGAQITAAPSAAPGEKPESIVCATRTEAKREYDAQNEPYYLNMMLDTNFKGSETEELAVSGGDLFRNEDYQRGDIWGSKEGMPQLLSGTDGVDTVVTTTGNYQAGTLYRKVRSTKTYEDSALYHETMFKTLSPSANHSMTMLLGVAEDQQNKQTAKLIYEKGIYTIETPDGHTIDLERDTDYTLKVGMIPKGNTTTVTYAVIKNGTECTASYQYDAAAADFGSANEVYYAIEAWVTPGEDVLKLHNARLYERREGEIIAMQRADLDTCYVREDMKLDLSKLPYLGSTLTAAPKAWGLIGANKNAEDFSYQQNGMYVAALKTNRASGAHTLVKGFSNPLISGESMELSMDLYLNATAPGMDSVGFGEIYLGNAAQSIKIGLTKYRFTPWNDENTGNYPFAVSFLDAGDGYQYQRLVDGNGDDPWKQNFIRVTLTLTPDGSGRYDAQLTAVNGDGDRIPVGAAGALTAAQVRSINTLFITYQQETAGSNLSDAVVFGVRDIRIRKFGKSMYRGDAAALSKGNEQSVGIWYDNITGAATEATLVTAAYDKGRLVACQSKKVYFEKGRGCINVDLPSDVTMDRYKLFLWRGDDMMIPYKAADVIKIQ